MERDRYGYPLTDVLADRFHPPLALSSSADAAERHEHQGAYNAYQERFRAAFMAKVFDRRRDQPG
ncbi:hypothetical protein ACFWZW_03440 [Microbacterium enclense]|uniref:hypothetical protein n=1 Tax=Microbacterium enclense TaxID=993073 RepID=UPI0036DA8192